MFIFSGCSSVKTKIQQDFPQNTISKEVLRNAIISVLEKNYFTVKTDGDNLVFTEWKYDTNFLDFSLNMYSSVMELSNLYAPKNNLLHSHNEYLFVGVVIEENKYILFGKRKIITDNDELVTDASNHTKKIRTHSVQVSNLTHQSKQDSAFLNRIVTNINTILGLTVKSEWISGDETITYDIENKLDLENAFSKSEIN